MFIPRAGDKVALSARSSFGAKILKTDGTVWFVREYRPKVLALGNKEGILVESSITGVWRWVKIDKDRDFDVNFLNKN